MRGHHALPILLPIALAFAGCVTPPADVETASAGGALPAATGTVTPYAFDGNFGPMVWTCPVVTCASIGYMSERSTQLDLQGNLTGFSLTLSWDAATPDMEQLRFGIGWGKDGMESEFVEGMSPLLFELGGIDISAADKPYLWTWAVGPAPIAPAGTSTPTDFHIEGTLTTTEAIA